MADFRDTIAELILVGRNGGIMKQEGNRVKAVSGSGAAGIVGGIGGGVGGGIGGGGIGGGGGGASSFPPPRAAAPPTQQTAAQQRKQEGSGGAYNFEQLTLD